MILGPVDARAVRLDGYRRPCPVIGAKLREPSVLVRRRVPRPAEQRCRVRLVRLPLLLVYIVRGYVAESGHHFLGLDREIETRRRLVRVMLLLLLGLGRHARGHVRLLQNDVAPPGRCLPIPLIVGARRRPCCSRLYVEQNVR